MEIFNDGTFYVLFILLVLCATGTYLLKQHYEENPAVVTGALWDWDANGWGIALGTIFFAILFLLRVLADFGILPGGHTGCFFC